MPTRIAAAFSSPFSLSGDLGVGTSSILGGSADATPTAASVAGSGQKLAGALGALTAAGAATSQLPTLEALGEGKLSTKQHKVIAALGAAPKHTLDIPWTSTGTEPSLVTTMRKYGWLKQVEPEFDKKTRLVKSASYSLTAVGVAIFKRTGGSKITGAAAAAGVNLLV